MILTTELFLAKRELAYDAECTGRASSSGYFIAEQLSLVYGLVSEVH